MSNRNLAILMMLLASIAVAAVGSDLYPPPAYYDTGTVVDWAQARIASGTALPAVASAAVGDLFRLTPEATTTTTLWCCVQVGSDTYWAQIGGASGGSGGGDHATLTNLGFSVSGHTGFASAGAILTSIQDHDRNAGHGCGSIASHAALTAHDVDNSTHGCSVVASESAVTAAVSAHSSSSAAHGCAVVASGSALTGHSTTNSTHGCGTIASESTVTAHTTSNTTHGCSSIASGAALTAHETDNSTHGCAVVASESYVDAAVAAVGGSLGITAETTTPATLTQDIVTRLSSIASITAVPCVVTIQAHGATWRGNASSTVADVRRCDKIADAETRSFEVASTSWDVGLAPDAAATSSVAITIGKLEAAP